MKKVAYFTNIAPHYRERLWLKILEVEEYDFHYYFGDPSKAGIKPIDFSSRDWNNFISNVHKIKNFRIKGRLIFQFGVLSKLLFNKWDACIFLGDPNLISTWIASFFLKVLGTKVIFWGHGLYGSEKGLDLWIRKVFLKIPNINLVYGNWAKNKMMEAGLNADKIEVIYNSLDYEQSFNLRNDSVEKYYFKNQDIFSDSYPVLIFIGRLTKQKRVNLLLDAIFHLKKYGQEYNLLIIGEGEERKSIERLSKEYGLNVYLYGACYDEKKIGKMMANADLCVSPGNVGLTAIHALSYGTPVCTHNDFTKQMPEVEAIEEGVSGCFFDKEKMNISEAINRWFVEYKERSKVRERCFSVIDDFYNPNNQIKIFLRILTSL